MENGYEEWLLSVCRHLDWAVQVGGERATPGIFQRRDGAFDQWFAVTGDAQFISSDFADHRAGRARPLRDAFDFGDMLWFQANDDARGRFPEEQGRRPADAAQFRVLA